MPVIDLAKPDIFSPAMSGPEGFAVTPGQADIDHGSDAPEEQPVPRSSVLGAAFRQDNTIGATLSSEMLGAPTNEEPGFNAWEAIRGTKYEPLWESFVDVRNGQALRAKMRQVDRELEDRRILEAAPWWKSVPAQLMAGVFDLPTLMPGGAFVRGVRGGISVSRSALSVGTAAGMASGVQETALQSLQELRPGIESGINIGASVLLGGLLGAGGARLLSNAEWSAAVKAINREVTGDLPVAIRGVDDMGARDYFVFAPNSRFVGEELTPQLRAEFAGSDDLIAEARVRISGDTANVSNVQVKEGFRRQGVASQLYDQIEGDLVERGVRLVPDTFLSDDAYAFWKQRNPDMVTNYVRKEGGGWEGTPNLEDAGGAAVPVSAGAAAVEPADIEANAIAGTAAAAVAGATAKLNPLLRALTSPSAAWRDISTQMVENSLYLKKNIQGVASAPAVETLMKEWNAGLARALKATDSTYSEYRKAGGALKRDEFRQAVGKAMRRGDEDTDPFVAKIAKEWRSQVFDPLKEAAIKAKLLPKDVTVETAASYFSRMWNRNRLVAREGQFKGIVQRWVQDNLPTWVEQYDKAAERRLNPLRLEIEDLEMAKLRRAEERRLREQGGEIEPGEFGEADIRQALRIVQGGAPKPKGVKTLTQFIHEQGGLVDFGGELAHMGITNKTRPGFVRATRRGWKGGVKGGWTLDDMTGHAWENGFFPEHFERPSINDFLEALRDDFFKTRRVVREADREAFRLQELVEQLEADLGRIGIAAGERPRFATSEEVKGMVDRVYAALDAQADARIAELRKLLAGREAEIRLDRESRFMDDPLELGRSIAKEVFDTLTGRAGEGVRPEFITIKARGPLKERTFNIPDELVEEFLEHDVEHVGRRYTRIMGADVELANRFGSVDMAEQVAKVHADYDKLRRGVKDETKLRRLADREKRDVEDLEALRDLLRGTRNPAEQRYDRIVRVFNHLNYIRTMGEVSLASLTEVVRPAMVHGLMPYLGTVTKLGTNLKAVKMSVAEAQLAGNVAERVLGTRLATLSEIADPYASRGPVEAFLENMTNIASKWNGIRMLTDMQKSIAAVMTQDRILKNVERFAGIKGKERSYMAYLGIDESMAERIARQFSDHGRVVDGVRVANTEKWTDEIARRTYRAAINKDVDSIITTKGVADVPLIANTPTGKALLQFKTFFLASYQRVLLRGLQEDQTRFLSGVLSMTAIGMLVTYLKAISGNREERLADISTNPGWWVSEGLDRSGIFSVPMELANTFEKATGLNPIKTPLKALDEGSRLSQRMQNRSGAGALLGPSIGFGDDIMTASGIPGRVLRGEEVTRGQKNAAERLLPFNSYVGMRQMLRYVANPPN